MEYSLNWLELLDLRMSPSEIACGKELLPSFCCSHWLLGYSSEILGFIIRNCLSLSAFETPLEVPMSFARLFSFLLPCSTAGVGVMDLSPCFSSFSLDSASSITTTSFEDLVSLSTFHRLDRLFSSSRFESSFFFLLDAKAAMQGTLGMSAFVV